MNSKIFFIILFFPWFAFASGSNAESEETSVSRCPFHFAMGRAREGKSLINQWTTNWRRRFNNRIYTPVFSTNVEVLQESHFDREKFPQRNLSLTNPDLQFLVDSEYEAEVHLRRELYRLNPNKVMMSADNEAVQTAGMEILEQFSVLLPRNYPDHFEFKDNVLINKRTRERTNITSPDGSAFVKAALMVQEDLILQKRFPDGTNRIIGGFLAFPSQWDLPYALGLSMEQIHAHSASSDASRDSLLRTINGTLNHISPGEVRLRNNWLLYQNPDLAVPTYRRLLPIPQSATIENVEDSVYVRIERQTITRLPKSGTTLFTIKVHVYQLPFMMAVPGVRDRLRNGIRLKIDELGSEAKPVYPLLLQYLESDQAMKSQSSLRLDD